MDEPEDPGGNTAMFRAFVSHGEPETAETPANRAPWIAAGVAVLVVLMVVVALAVR
jgi:hypothetical protein